MTTMIETKWGKWTHTIDLSKDKADGLLLEQAVNHYRRELNEEIIATYIGSRINDGMTAGDTSKIRQQGRTRAQAIIEKRTGVILTCILKQLPHWEKLKPLMALANMANSSSIMGLGWMMRDSEALSKVSTYYQRDRVFRAACHRVLIKHPAYRLCDWETEIDITAMDHGSNTLTDGLPVLRREWQDRTAEWLLAVATDLIRAVHQLGKVARKELLGGKVSFSSQLTWSRYPDLYRLASTQGRIYFGMNIGQLRVAPVWMVATMTGGCRKWVKANYDWFYSYTGHRDVINSWEDLKLAHRFAHCPIAEVDEAALRGCPIAASVTAIRAERIPWGFDDCSTNVMEQTWEPRMSADISTILPGWEGEELLGSKALVQEGHDQHHCVGMYSYQCRTGSAVVLKITKPIRATVCLDKHGHADQCRMACNKMDKTCEAFLTQLRLVKALVNW